MSNVVPASTNPLATQLKRAESLVTKIAGLAKDATFKKKQYQQLAENVQQVHAFLEQQYALPHEDAVDTTPKEAVSAYLRVNPSLSNSNHTLVVFGGNVCIYGKVYTTESTTTGRFKQSSQETSGSIL